MQLGYDGAQHYYGGLAEWMATGRYLVVETPEVVDSLLADGAVLVDVRDPLPFEGGHIPGARNVPLAELLADPAAVLGEVGELDTIVLYDEGGQATESVLAARELEASGYGRVRRYAGGFSEWSDSGRATDAR